MKIFRHLPAFALALVAAASAVSPAPAAASALAPQGAQKLTEKAITHQLTEKAKIEALIVFVEAQPKTVFIRNGSEHTAKEAGAHLRMKWNHAGDRIHTANQFIDNIASKSSMTGRKYRIRLSDGQELDAGDYFRAELKRIEARRS